MENNQTLPFDEATAPQTATVEQPVQNLPLAVNESSPLASVPQVPVFNDKQSFEHAQRVSKMLGSSSLVPKDYQNNIPNIMIALEMANRIGASPLMVMQNLNIIQGRPSWSSQFIISALNSCKRFSPLRFKMEGEGDEYGCTAWAKDHSGEILEGPKVTWKMAKDEGWSTKGGSKWKTMPELMFRYRAAAFFGRLYAPDVLMGMGSADEADDIVANETQLIDQRQQGFNNALNALQ